MEVKRLKIEIKRFKKSPKELHHQKKKRKVGILHKSSRRILGKEL